MYARGSIALLRTVCPAALYHGTRTLTRCVGATADVAGWARHQSDASTDIFSAEHHVYVIMCGSIARTNTLPAIGQPWQVPDLWT
jgi:hypothetical protein